MQTVSSSQFVAVVEGLLSSVRPEMFMSQPVTRIVLLFGPSPNRPCEIYDISLRAEQHAECVPGATADGACLSTRGGDLMPGTLLTL